jgi:hypothetical protein
MMFRTFAQSTLGILTPIGMYLVSLPMKRMKKHGDNIIKAIINLNEVTMNHNRVNIDLPNFDPIFFQLISL